MAAQPAAGWLLRIQRFYEEHERALGLTFFLAGIVWDALTLRTIDNPVDNLILIGYLLALTAVIVLDIRAHTGQLSWKRIEDPQAWLRAGMQFLLGALLSAFVVFYSRSITWSAHLAFWLILVVGAVLNEFLTRRLSSFPAQLAFLFICASTMLAWLLPVITGEMSQRMFRLALAGSVALTAGVFLYGRIKGRVRGSMAGPVEVWIVVGLLILMDVGYRANWIPPVPLSVQEGGVYNQVSRQDDSFLLEWKTKQRGLLSPDYARTLYWEPGEAIYGFTAVFAPTRLEKTVVHEWQRWDEEDQTWMTTDRIDYRMNGGREDGYRGTSFKRNVNLGRWRIVVRTEEGKVLTKIPFDIVPGPPDGVYVTRRLER